MVYYNCINHYIRNTLIVIMEIHFSRLYTLCKHNKYSDVIQILKSEATQKPTTVVINEEVKVNFKL